MRKWYVAFTDTPQEGTIVEEGDLGADALKRFDKAAKIRKYKGREVLGMWIIDHATEQGDVIKKHGRYPHTLHARHHAWKRGRHKK